MSRLPLVVSPRKAEPVAARKKRKPERCQPCGKRTYHSYGAAVHYALKHSGMYGQPMAVYECPIVRKCWHLTTQDWKEREPQCRLSPTFPDAPAEGSRT